VLSPPIAAGLPVRSAVLDALAALQWTDPEGPFTRLDAARRLMARVCSLHRGAVMSALKELGPDWTPPRGTRILRRDERRR
jgi:hypothetical protein